jgi:hypothetical protein
MPSEFATPAHGSHEMRQRSYLASVASPIGAREALAFPQFRPAPEEARASVAEPRTAHSASSAIPPQIVRRKPAKARSAGEPFSLADAAEPPPAPGLTAINPSAPVPPAPKASTPPNGPEPLAGFAPPPPSLQPLEPAAEPLAVNRSEITPLAAGPFTPTPFSEEPAPAAPPGSEASLLPFPRPGAPPPAASPRLAAPSDTRAKIFGDEILAPAPIPPDAHAPSKISDPFRPPPPASSAPEWRTKIPRVEIGVLEVRGAPASQPQAPAPVAVVAPRPSGPVARGYGWRYGPYQG